MWGKDFIGMRKLGLRDVSVIFQLKEKEHCVYTRYQPVGLPVSPILEWDVRTKRTFGAMLKFGFDLYISTGIVRPL
jgi:hypothetical protein